jgi:hypothetical protein
MSEAPSSILRFPYGYAKDSNGVMGMGTLLTRSQLELTTTVKKLNPEFWRRSIALFEFAAQRGIPLGVGTGWRVQPNPPPAGFAKPGNSNHEGFPADGESGGAVAIDTVPAPSWPWMENNVAAFGLRTFKNVNSEPWHIQPVDIPASRSQRSEPWNLQTWNLPGDDTDESEEEMPLTDDDCKKIAKAVWDHAITGDTADENKPARWRLKQIQNMCRYYLGGVQESTPLPDQTLLKQIHQNTKP